VKGGVTSWRGLSSEQTNSPTGTFSIAKGSAAEVLTRFTLSKEIGYITAEHFEYIENDCQAVDGMLTRLVQSRSSKC
jgi:four helix bundle protein